MQQAFCIHDPTSVDSPNCGSKIFRKKINSYICIEHVQTFFLVFIPWTIQCNNYLHSVIIHCIRYYKSSRDDLKYNGGWAQVLCKYSFVLYETWASTDFDILGESWNQSPIDIEGQLCMPHRNQSQEDTIKEKEGTLSTHWTSPLRSIFLQWNTYPTCLSPPWFSAFWFLVFWISALGKFLQA